MKVYCTVRGLVLMVTWAAVIGMVLGAVLVQWIAATGG